MDDGDGFPQEWLKVIESLRLLPPEMIIKCGGEEHKVHKLMMTSASTFFDKACNGSFQEGKTSVVHLPEDNPETVAAMIAYLYFRDYDRVIQDLTYSALERGKWFSPARLHLNDEVPSTCVAWADLQDLGDSKHEIPFHIAMYRLAHKYGIEGLQAKAERELEIIIDGYGLDWDSDTIVVLVNQLKSVSSLGNGMNLVPQSLARIIVFSTKRHLKCCKVLEAIRDFAELNYQMVLFQWGP